MSSLRVEKLQSLIRTGTSSCAPDFRAALAGLHAELIDRQVRSLPESKDYFIAVVQALRRVKGAGNYALRMQCVHLCWQYFFWHGHIEQSLEAGNDHYILALQTGTPESLRLSYNLQGVAYAEAGNISEALCAYSAAIRIAREQDDLAAECKVLNNVGTALNYAGLYREAIPCFERIIQLASPSWDYPVDMNATSNLAQTYYHLGNYQEALLLLDRCLAGRSVKGVEASFQRTIREFMYVQVALEIGQCDLAVVHAQHCMTSALAIRSNRCTVMAETAMARCEVSTGQVNSGLSRLERTLEVSKHLIDSSYRDVLLAIVKAYDEAGQPDVALRYIELLVSHIRQRRADCTNALLSLCGSPLYAILPNLAQGESRILERRWSELRIRVAERDLENAKCEMLERLAVTADLKDDASGEHGYRVGKLAGLIAVTLGWSDQASHQLEIAARLHDLGKLGVSDQILRESPKLSKNKRDIAWRHTVIGAQLLANSEIPQMRMAEEIALRHHESWDGSGYPDQMAGRSIPIHARIVSIADAFDVLTHGRSDNRSRSKREAVEEIVARRGNQFDGDLVNCFVRLLSNIEEKGPDLDEYLSSAARESPLSSARTRLRMLLRNDG